MGMIQSRKLMNINDDRFCISVYRMSLISAAFTTAYTQRPSGAPNSIDIVANASRSNRHVNHCWRCYQNCLPFNYNLPKLYCNIFVVILWRISTSVSFNTIDFFAKSRTRKANIRSERRFRFSSMMLTMCALQMSVLLMPRCTTAPS